MLQVLYLIEKVSEHPIAKAICKTVLSKIPSLIKNVETRFEVLNFKNRNGEGVTALIKDKETSKELEVLCGNLKLMSAFQVLDQYPEIQKNIQFLEEEGKTVICLTIDNVPALIVSLQEEHLSKQEAQYTVKFLQETMGYKVCMITGDNKHSALQVAKHLGILEEDVTYQAYPETKREVVMKY